MKKLNVLSTVALASFCFSATAAMDPYVENTLISVCKAGMSNSVVRFNDTMKDYRINEQRIFPKLVCNGETFYNFALSHGANRTAERISRYLPGEVIIKDLSMNLSDELIYVTFDE
ncbi:DUF3718 domain-containing protein [Shewanella sp.]|uniref:DUF3718 domain-containing protein n=1 Tax=Shewanella sp. TaxID=50422 RepID=UPI0035618302